MSNIKRFVIRGTVPWDWTGQMEADNLAQIASLTMAPLVNATISYGEVQHQPIPTGDTSVFPFLIEGREAVGWPYLRTIAEALAGLDGAAIKEAWAQDVEEQPIPPPESLLEDVPIPVGVR